LKVIIAGGRDFQLGDEDLARLDREVGPVATLVLTGGASGVDAGAERWAHSRGIPVQVVEARWQELGKMAGPIRNGEMAKQADMVVLFPGGRGTGSMAKLAQKHGLKILDWR